MITVPVPGTLMVDNGEALLTAARVGMAALLPPYAPDQRMTPKLPSFIDFVIAAFGIHAQGAVAQA